MAAPDLPGNTSAAFSRSHRQKEAIHCCQRKHDLPFARCRLHTPRLELELSRPSLDLAGLLNSLSAGTHTILLQTIHPKKKMHPGFVCTVLAHVFITRRFKNLCFAEVSRCSSCGNDPPTPRTRILNEPSQLHDECGALARTKV